MDFLRRPGPGTSFVWVGLLAACGGSPESKGGGASSAPPTESVARHVEETSAPSAQTSSAPPAREAAVFDAVRIDPKTFLETPLGKVRFEPAPPFRGTVIEGDEALKKIVEEANALDHVVSAGLSGKPGTKVVRSEDQFFRIMRFGWLKSTHGLTLRAPAIPSVSPTRWNVVQRKGDAYRTLGAIALDANGYLQVLGGPEAERPALGELAVEVNERYAFSRDIPPPPGKTGKWGRTIDRGTTEHRAALRDRLLEDGFVLLPEALAVPDHFVEVRRTTSASTLPWLSMDVSGDFSTRPETPEVPLHVVSSSGSSPTELRIVRYRELAREAAALAARVGSEHAQDEAFVAGNTAEVDIAARRLLATTFRTGKPPAAQSHVVVLWPRRSGPEADAPPADDGVLIEIAVTGGPQEAQALVDHASVRALIQSLRIDLEPYD